MSTNKSELKHETGLFSAISVLVGIAINSGIFTVSGKVATPAGSVGPIILAQLIAGVGAILYVLVYAELSPTMPEADSSYVCIDEAFGHYASSVYGWSMIFGLFLPIITMTASAFTSNSAVLFPGLNLSITGERLVATALVSILAGINLLGVKNGSAVQNIFVVAKVTVLVVASVGGLFALKPENFTTMTTETVEWGDSLAITAPTLAAMEDCYTLSHMSGETKNPKHNLPLATIIDMGIIIIINILLTVACVGSVGFANLAGLMTPVNNTTQAAFGSFGTALVTLGATVSILGSTNGTPLSFPRVAYVMARNRMMFSFFSKLHPKYKTLYITILVYAAGAVVFIWTGNFVTFLVMSMFVGCLSETAVCLLLFVLRKKQPDIERPFRMWGYPVTVILATVITMMLACSASIQEIISESLLILTSMPTCFIFLYTHNGKQSSTADQ